MTDLQLHDGIRITVDGRRFVLFREDTGTFGDRDAFCVFEEGADDPEGITTVYDGESLETIETRIRHDLAVAERIRRERSPFEEFTTRVGKQGNSLIVNITPQARRMGLDRGDRIRVRLERMEEEARAENTNATVDPGAGPE